MIRLYKNVLFLTIAVTAMLLGTSEAFAIGVSPAKTTIGPLLPNTSIEKKLTVTRRDVYSTEEVMIRASESIAPYIVFPKGSSFIFSVNQQRFEVPYILTVPSEIKEYSGSIFVVSKPTNQASMPLGFELEVESKLLFSVTENSISEFTIHDPKLEYHTEEDELYFNLNTENSGNVPHEVASITIIADAESFVLPLKEIFIIPPYTNKAEKFLVDLPFKKGRHEYLVTLLGKENKVLYEGEKREIYIAKTQWVPLIIQKWLPPALIGFIVVVLGFSIYIITRHSKRRR